MEFEYPSWKICIVPDEGCHIYSGDPHSLYNTQSNMQKQLSTCCSLPKPAFLDGDLYYKYGCVCFKKQ